MTTLPAAVEQLVASLSDRDGPSCSTWHGCVCSPATISAASISMAKLRAAVNVPAAVCWLGSSTTVGGDPGAACHRRCARRQRCAYLQPRCCRTASTAAAWRGCVCVSADRPSTYPMDAWKPVPRPYTRRRELYVLLRERERAHELTLAHLTAEPAAWHPDGKGGVIKPDAYVRIQCADTRRQLVGRSRPSDREYSDPETEAARLRRLRSQWAGWPGRSHTAGARHRAP